MARISLLLLLIFILPQCSKTEQGEKGSLSKKVVGLDYFYNNEWLMEDEKPVARFHYTWEDTAMSGYSEFGKLFQKFGADIISIPNAPTEPDLAELSIYIIVDPDTPQETKEPHYLDEPAITSIVRWVENGGVLMLMGNNKGNAEFEHLNKLANRFGITFNENSRNDSTDETLHIAAFTAFPEHPIFKGVGKLYIKGICTFKVEPPAEALYTDSNDVIIATAHIGEGTVFAVGDPWFYNEYIDFKDYNNRTAAMNLIPWLLDRAKPVK